VRLGTVAIVLTVLLASLVAGAHAGENNYRVGVLSPDAPPPGILQGLRDGLYELGYEEGKTITIESRNARGRTEQLATMAQELVRLKVDAIVAVNTSAAQAAKNATATIPIVITRVADPVRTGLVSSLSRPGGNVTGLSFQTEELIGKRLELLKEAVPRLSSVAVLWYAHNPGSALIASELDPGSVQLGIRLLRLPVQSPTDFSEAFANAARDRAGALIVIDDAFVTSHRSRILELAAKQSLPVMSQFSPYVEEGGLIAYGPSERDMYRRAAHYIDKIFKGAKPADLPIEQPTKYELVINLKTARSLSLTIPQSLLVRADHVIQ